MQSKIIFVVLFILSFVITHDTVINIVQINDKVPVSHYVSNDIDAQECLDIHQMHCMFHFIGLIVPASDDIIHLVEKEKTLSHYLLQYTLLHKENSDKPPIV